MRSEYDIKNFLNSLRRGMNKNNSLVVENMIKVCEWVLEEDSNDE